MPTDRQVQAATDLAVGATRPDATSGEALALARHGPAHLALVPIPPERDWALAVLVSPHGSELAPNRLTQLVPLDQEKYVARGESWWPEPDAVRWVWVIGRFTGEHVEVTYGGRSSLPPISPDGWFVHLETGGAAGEEIRVRVHSSGGIQVQ